jgi:hypothetical protein
MRRTVLDDRLRRASWPEPGAELRERVLSAAGPRVNRTVTWADRLWFSRPFRVAVLGLAVALTALDVATAPAGRAAIAPAPASLAAAMAVEDAARQIGLPPEQAAAFSRDALAMSSGTADTTGLTADTVLEPDEYEVPR